MSYRSKQYDELVKQAAQDAAYLAQATAELDHYVEDSETYAFYEAQVATYTLKVANNDLAIAAQEAIETEEPA